MICARCKIDVNLEGASQCLAIYHGLFARAVAGDTIFGSPDGHDMAMGMRGAPQIGEGVSGVGLGDDGERLAAAVARGDAEATRRLVEVVGSVILDAVRMVLGPNHADFEAVTERALMHLVESMGTFGGECSVSHVAGRVAVVAALASRRHTHDHRISVAD